MVHFGDQQIFDEATTYTCLLFLAKSSQDSVDFIKVNNLATWRDGQHISHETIPALSITEADWNFVVGEGLGLFQKLACMPNRLKDISARIFQGIIPGADKVYAVQVLQVSDGVARCYSRALEAEVMLEVAMLRRIVSGTDVGRFVLNDSDTNVIFPYAVDNFNAKLISEEDMAMHYPHTYEYFQRNADDLGIRDRGSAIGKNWYRFIRTQNIGLQSSAKIAVPRLVRRLRAGLDLNGSYCLDNVDVGGILLDVTNGLSSKYVTGLLNSKLLNFYFQRSAAPFRGGFYSANRQFIENIPVHRIDFTKPAEQAKHDQMVSLVDRMLTLHKDKTAVRLAREKAMVEQQITETDAQIDRLVYDLYGLTDEEIAIVEGAG